jgi:hypothetical protein
MGIPWLDVTLLVRETTQWYSAGLWAGRPGFNSRQGHWWNFFSSPPRPYQLWGPPSLPSNRYRGLVLWNKAAGAWSHRESNPRTPIVQPVAQRLKYRLSKWRTLIGSRVKCCWAF